MILYNVTVMIENSVHDEWLEWMNKVHIPQVLDTGLFLSNRVLRLMEEEPNPDGKTYAFEYILRSLEEYHIYQLRYAPALQKEHRERYEGKFVAVRSLLEVVHQNQFISKN